MQQPMSKRNSVTERLTVMVHRWIYEFLDWNDSFAAGTYLGTIVSGLIMYLITVVSACET